MAATRIESDSFGEIEVPNDRLWGAQTQRSLSNFRISTELVPHELILALALVKKAAAQVNADLQLLDQAKAAAIVAAADEVIAGRHGDQFPLVVWQTGSGTQTHMNMNEVLANRASEILGGPRGTGRLVHANDHVNKGQSSNDVFPTAMHVAAVGLLRGRVIPAIGALRNVLTAKSEELRSVVKLGRTHLQDATPITLGQEISGWAAQVAHGLDHLESALPHLHALAIGGTAVGTGMGAHPEFGSRVCTLLSAYTRETFTTAQNPFEALASHDAMVWAHGALRGIAAALTKIANDVRWLASGPRAGLGEITIPENEPGSSIMPGKVNPTQAEALLMACLQVIANDVAIGFAGASGNFELNVWKPLIAHSFLQSCRLLADGCDSFRAHCASGIEANLPRIKQNLESSLMLATALSPHIGYDAASRIAISAHREGKTLRQAAVDLGLVTPEDFDRWVRPEDMTGI